MEYQIFISYRRDGGESLAALLYERFVQMGYRVFYDVESLRSGNFNEKLLKVIEQCQDVLLVLPPDGLNRCIQDENDWVRREITHALLCKKNVIPVMMRNFVFPDNLPDDLKILPDLNGISANMEFFDAVVDRIADKLLISRPKENMDEEAQRLDHLKRQAAAGSAAALNELGTVYEQGSLTLVQNLRKAHGYYQKAYELGSMAAEYNLGEMYEACAEDLTLLSEYGIEMQMDCDSTPEAIKELMKETAWSYYESAAKKEYAPALYKLGNRKEEALELSEAFSCYEQAAKQKYLPAMNALAWMYRNGIGTDADPQKAEVLYQEAADAGYPPAVYNYANTIELREPEKAMNLYKKVAYGEQALPIASYALGRRYEYGLRDMRNAISCYERAAEGGIDQALEDLERCRNMLV